MAPSQLSLAVSVSVQPGVSAAGLGWPQTFDVGQQPLRDAAWRGRDGDGAWSGSQCLFAHSLRKFSMRDWGIEQKWMSILLPLLLLYNGRPFGAVPLHTESWRASRGRWGPEQGTHGMWPQDSRGQALSSLLGGLGSGWEPSCLPLSPAPESYSFQSCGWREQTVLCSHPQSNLFSGFSVCKTRQPLVHCHPLGSDRGESHPEPCAPVAGAPAGSAFSRPACLLPSRPVLPPVLPGEQLVPGDAGRPVPVRVPVRPAALLAVRVPRDPGAGEPLALTLPLQALVTVLR